MNRPPVERDTGWRVLPFDARIGKSGARAANRLADSEKHIVGRDGNVSLTEPDLEEPRVDVDECRSPEPPQDGRADSALEVE